MTTAAAENPFQNVTSLPGQPAPGEENLEHVDVPDGEDDTDPTASLEEEDNAAVAEDDVATKPTPKEVQLNALADMPSMEKDWPHDTINFGGHTLGCRLPTEDALTSFSMSTGDYVPENIQRNMVSLFVQQHFSPQSYTFLMVQMMLPDSQFTRGTFSDVVTKLIEEAGKKLIAAAEAKKPPPRVQRRRKR